LKSFAEFIMMTLFALFLIFVSLVPSWMYFNFFLTPEKEAVQHEIVELQSEKGLFLNPRYQAVIDDGTSHYLSKKEFDSLQVGDHVKGHYTYEYGFFTKWDQIYGSVILIPLMIILPALFGMVAIGMFLSLFDDDEIKYKDAEGEEAKDEAKKKKDKKKKAKKDWFGYSLLAIVTIIVIAYTSVYTGNLIHKIIPVGQTEAEGKVMDREKEEKFRASADYSSYELTIRFTAEDGEEYQVKKGVTRQTFEKYIEGMPIKIKYRDKNPYDIFVKTKSFDETMMTFFNIYTMFYLLGIFILYLLISHFWSSSKEEDQAATE